MSIEFCTYDVFIIHCFFYVAMVEQKGIDVPLGMNALGVGE